MSIFILTTFDNQTIKFDIERSLPFRNFVNGIAQFLELSTSLSFRLKISTLNGLPLTPSLYETTLNDPLINNLSIKVVIDYDKEAYEEFKKDLYNKKQINSLCYGTPLKNTFNRFKGEKYARL